MPSTNVQSSPPSTYLGTSAASRTVNPGRAALMALWTATIVFSVYWVIVVGLEDFGSFVASGRAITAGHNPYVTNSPLVSQNVLPFSHALHPSPNLNPPVWLPLFQFLGSLDPSGALWLWRGVSALMYGLSLLLLHRAYPELAVRERVAYALALAGFWHTLALGQVYLPLVLAATGSLLAFKSGRHLLAGVLVGVIVAAKPNFAVWPALLLVAGYRRPAITAIITAGLLTMLPAKLYGAQVYMQWANASMHYGLVAFPGNSSLTALAERFGVSWLGPVLSVVLLLVIVAWTRKSRPSVIPVCAVGILVSLLASPIAWVGYTTVLLPFLWAERWNRELRLAMGLLCVPAILLIRIAHFSLATYLVAGAFYLFALIFLLIILMQSWTRN